MHGAITTTTALHESIYAAISSVSQGPCLQLLYHRIRFLSLENGALLHSPSRNHKQGISCITQWARCKESCGCKSANVQMGKGPSSRKGAALSSPFLYTSPRSQSQRERARSVGQWRDGQRAVTDKSPSAVLCHRRSWPGAKQAGETSGWWLGHVTISGLGT